MLILQFITMLILEQDYLTCVRCFNLDKGKNCIHWDPERHLIIKLIDGDTPVFCGNIPILIKANIAERRNPYCSRSRGKLHKFQCNICPHCVDYHDVQLQDAVFQLGIPPFPFDVIPAWNTKTTEFQSSMETTPATNLKENNTPQTTPVDINTNPYNLKDNGGKDETLALDSQSFLEKLNHILSLISSGELSDVESLPESISPNAGTNVSSPSPPSLSQSIEPLRYGNTHTPPDQNSSIPNIDIGRPLPPQLPNYNGLRSSRSYQKFQNSNVRGA